MNTMDNIRIFWALTRRDLYVLSKQIKDFFIDGLVIITIRMLVFCYLFPVMGMPKELAGPLYIGNVISLFLNINFAQAVRVVFDLKSNQLINYHLILPISRTWLWLQKIVSFALATGCITLPIIGGSIFILSSQISTLKPQILPFLCVYTLALLFFSTFFLTLVFSHPYTWFLDNVWPRRLTPMFCLGGVLFPWKMVYAFWPALGFLFLCNPFTYIAEGLRGTLFEPTQFIPYSICIPMIIGATIIGWHILLVSIKKRLNPL